MGPGRAKRCSKRRRSGNRRWLLIPALVGALLLGTAATAAANESRVVAALGDSFSSGTGTHVYDPASGSCERSPLAYPALAAKLRREQLAFLACSGATTDDVRAQAAAIPAGARLVTVTVGGDDVNFTAVLEACAGGTPQECQAAIQAGLGVLNTTLPDSLALTFTAIRAQAPQAQFVVLGYPHLFGTGPCTAAGLPSADERAAIDSGTDGLDAALQAAATAAGATYVDVRARFQNHGACAPLVGRWINAVVAPESDSFHPNIAGHALGYLPALLAASRGLAASPRR
jgi:lysophospholipase L1-like esterase